MNPIDSIPKTQIRPPVVNQKLLARPQLVERVTAAVRQHKLTVITAPAGFGKTTLAVAVTQALQNVPIAWVRLSETENEVPAFMHAVVSAWHHLYPHQFANSRGILQNRARAHWELSPVLGTFVNELLTIEAPLAVMILDDYQRIHAPAVHQGVEALLEKSPPHVRLLLTSRAQPPLPISRLRLRGDVALFDLHDLEFTREEIQAYFQEIWGIALTPAEGELLLHRTGGWVASLHLFALALQQGDSTNRLQDVMRGASGSNQLVYELLAEEVFLRQPPEIREFLIHTAILSELTPQLCRAVLAQENGADLLETVARRNLFLLPQEGALRYRYHDLFREFLQHRLATRPPEFIRELHRRAGEAHPDPAEKIRHYLVAEEWNNAAKVLVQEGEKLLAEGHMQLVEQWIGKLPPALVRRTPELQYLRGISALHQGDFTTAQRWLHQAQAGFHAQKNEAAEGQALLQLANYYSAMHNAKRTLFYLKKALTKPLQPYQQVQAHITATWMHIYSQGLRTHAHTDLAEALRITRQSGDPIAYTILGHQLRAPVLLSRLGIRPFERYCREVLQQFGDDRPTPAVVGALCLLNVILLLKGRPEEAQHLRRNAQRLIPSLGYPVYIAIGLDITECWDGMFHGDYERVERYWQQHLPFYERSEGQRQWLVSFLSLRGLAFHLAGKQEAFQEVVDHMQRELMPRDLPENHIATETLLGISLMQQHQWRDAEAVWQRAIERLESAPHGILLANPFVWLAHYYLTRGWKRQAREVMEALFHQYNMKEMGGILLREGEIVLPLLELLENTPAVQHVMRLWNRIRRPRAVSIPRSVETLSPREMEVLRLIAAGARNHEIADQLCISLRTVKAHVSRILAKLNVQSRTQAVARAQHLQIL